MKTPQPVKYTMAIFAVALCFAGPFGGSAEGASRRAQCKLVVKGKTYIDGPCDFEQFGGDGSFRINGGAYFAYVNVSGNSADASWNESPQSTHAQAPLGTLRRNGACWESATVQICAK